MVTSAVPSWLNLTKAVPSSSFFKVNTLYNSSVDACLLLFKGLPTFFFCCTNFFLCSKWTSNSPFSFGKGNLAWNL